MFYAKIKYSKLECIAATVRRQNYVIKCDNFRYEEEGSDRFD